MNDAEKAAEEWTSIYMPATPSSFNIRLYGQKAFLAGLSHALKPRRITADASTWPELHKIVMLFDGKEWWFGYKGTGMQFFYHFGDGQKSDKKFTYWMPLPPTPQEE